MAKIIKGHNENFRRMGFYFVVQIILGVLPAILLVLFIALKMYETQVFLGYIFIGIMIGAAALNLLASKRYNVLLSGFRGEKSLLRTIKRIKGDFTVFVNLPVKYKKNRSEIDLLLISETYILIIEVKNHSGTISGQHKDDFWIQRKSYRDGKVTETNMSNPLKQLRRQRDIFKSILRANDTDVWVETMLYFSSPIVRLRLNLNDNDNVCSSEKELFSFLADFKPERPLNKSQTDKIVELFKAMID